MLTIATKVLNQEEQRLKQLSSLVEDKKCFQLLRHSVMLSPLIITAQSILVVGPVEAQAARAQASFTKSIRSNGTMRVRINGRCVLQLDGTAS